MPRITTDLTPLARIAKEAGQLALSMQDDIVLHQRTEAKADGSDLTPADKATHKLIMERLAAAFPGVPVHSEESTPEERAEVRKSPRRIEVDPIDNTKAYFRGEDGYSVNIGLIENGVPVAGAVYFPKKGELYFTGTNGEALRQIGDGTPTKISVSQVSRNQQGTKAIRVVGSMTSINLEHLENHGRPLQPFQEPAQYSTMKVADGTYDITGLKRGTTGYNTWDVAGPDAVLRAAGGMMIDQLGNPLTYGESEKVPNNHMGAGIDTLINLGLTTREQVLGRQRGAAVG